MGHISLFALIPLPQAAICYLFLLKQRGQAQPESTPESATEGRNSGSSQHATAGGSRKLPIMALVSELEVEASSLLQSHASVQVRFDAKEAVSELLKLGLIKASVVGGNGAHAHPPQLVVTSVCSVSDAVKVVQGQWDQQLWSRVDSILREFEA